VYISIKYRKKIINHRTHAIVVMIFTVLLLSGLHGSLGSFRLLTNVTDGMCVSMLPAMFFLRGTCFGDFHPTLVIEGKIFLADLTQGGSLKFPGALFSFLFL